MSAFDDSGETSLAPAFETQEAPGGSPTAITALPGPLAPEPSLIEALLADASLDAPALGQVSARGAVVELLTRGVRAGRGEGALSRTAIDSMIAEIDDRLNGQLNAILHHERFQALESIWRSLKFLVDRVDFNQKVKVEFVNISREDLETDIEDAPTLTKSGFFNLCYSREYGQFGGEPYGLLCGAYDFDTSVRDLALLKQVASVAAMAHAPFLANVGHDFFGLTDLEAVTQLRELKTHLEAPQFIKWQQFRESPDACYVGLCLPRFLLRAPYEERAHPLPHVAFNEETEGPGDYLWGFANVAMATRVADSFAKYRWCPNIIGPQSGGTVPDLPLAQYHVLEGIQAKIPTEVLITERREFELAEEGFIALTFRKDSDDACFFSANSVQKPKFFGNDSGAKALEVNHRLGTQLPYMFIVSRLAHYVKVMQREQLGGYKTRTELERELNGWLNNYVADMENPNMRVRASRPLRKAAVHVEEVEGQAGWFKCRVEVQPHMKYMGASFTLSLVGRLDK